MTVAYNDPLLRTAGLVSDRLGDAMRFFELSEHEAHRVACSCMHGRTVEGCADAIAVRVIAAGWVIGVSLVAAWSVAALPIVGFIGYLLTKFA